MALIKCKRCGKKISDKATKCIHCGCHIKKDSKIIVIAMICFIVLLSLCIFYKKNKLVCKYTNENYVGTIDYKITYIFKNGSIKSLKGYQYAKPNDSDVAEGLWAITNNQQSEYNYYAGLKYKATFSENNEIVLNYSIDVEKAPKMFNTIASLSGVEGIKSYMKKDEIKKIYEQNDFVCN